MFFLAGKNQKAFFCLDAKEAKYQKLLPSAVSAVKQNMVAAELPLVGQFPY